MKILEFAYWVIEKKQQFPVERVVSELWRRGPIRNAIRRGIFSRRPLFNLSEVVDAVQGRSGIEIGGPSPVFRPRDVIPIYSLVGHLDVCNFGPETMWEGKLEDGAEITYLEGKAKGRQLLREATNLTGVVDGAYDFVLSSHCLEHIANPLKALLEWRRIVKPGGHLLLIVPHPHYTFDHNRPVTSFEHLVEDSERQTGEDDLTHLSEILQLHDFFLDPGAKSREAFEKRSRDNLNNRGLHHHIFSPQLTLKCLEWAGFKTKFVEDAGNLHIVALGQKP